MMGGVPADEEVVMWFVAAYNGLPGILTVKFISENSAVVESEARYIVEFEPGIMPFGEIAMGLAQCPSPEAAQGFLERNERKILRFVDKTT